MYYIYRDNQFVGTSDTHVSLPEGYTLSNIPPIVSQQPGKQVELPPVVTRPGETFTDEDIAALRDNLAKVSPFVADSLELVLRLQRGETDKVNTIIRKLKVKKVPL